MTAKHGALSLIFQETGSERFHLDHTVVSQELRVLTRMYPTPWCVRVHRSVCYVTQLLDSPKQIKRIRAEKASWTSWRLNKSIWFVNAMLAFCCFFGEHNAFIWFNYFLTKSLALNQTRTGTGFVWPTNLKCLTSHVILLQRALYDKTPLLPFSGHVGRNSTLACSQKGDLDYMTIHVHDRFT